MTLEIKVQTFGEESDSAMNPGSCLNDEMVEFASIYIDVIMNDSLQIVSVRSTITAEEV